MTYRLLTVLLATAFLLACGGSPSSSQHPDNTTPTTTPVTTPTITETAQGAYFGTATMSGTQMTFEGIVLPDDRLCAIYGVVQNNVLHVAGFLTGQGISNIGNYGVTLLREYYLTQDGVWAMHSGTLSASYTPKQSLQGTISISGVSVQFTGTVPPTTNYDFNKPASLAEITGSWTLYFLSGSSGNFISPAINADGSFNGVLGDGGPWNGCDYSGKIIPDTTKNYASVSISFYGHPGQPAGWCFLEGSTVSGIALVTTADTGAKQLLIGVTTASGGYGDFLFGNQ